MKTLFYLFIKRIWSLWITSLYHPYYSQFARVLIWHCNTPRATDTNNSENLPDHGTLFPHVSSKNANVWTSKSDEYKTRLLISLLMQNTPRVFTLNQKGGVLTSKTACQLRYFVLFAFTMIILTFLVTQNYLTTITPFMFL